MPLTPTEYEATGTGRTGQRQFWQVPQTGTYKIEAFGAQGGSGGREGEGGLGARISALFRLEKDEIIAIDVGQQGVVSYSMSCGGGGGTFVAKQKERVDFFQLSDSGAPVPGISPETVYTAEISARVRVSTGRSSLLGTPNGEAFSVGLDEGRMFLSNFWASQSYVSEVAVVRDAWVEVRWSIDFYNGVCEFFVEDSLLDVWVFSPFEVPVSSLELFTRDGNDNFSGGISRLSFTMNEDLLADYLTMPESDGLLEDVSGSGRSVNLSNVQDDFYFDYEPLLVAGGGGGFGVGTSDVEERRLIAHAHLEEWGKDGIGGNSSGEGGRNGLGGGRSSFSRGDGGAGFYGDGHAANFFQRARSFVDGSTGGSGSSSNGGFGGGGSCPGNYSNGSTAGGGGFSGGGGSGASSNADSSAGGGGGSFSAGSETEGDAGFNEGHGLVIIYPPLLQKEGRAITEDGYPVDKIYVFLDDGSLFYETTPDNEGRWTLDIVLGLSYYITYLAAEHQPKTHGPYIFTQQGE